ncbi:MAG: hypothetical protein KGN78_14575, partial [Actinomycetales bacterium]|nr:hypothetical protein [Actinomycetales bacterium]
MRKSALPAPSFVDLRRLLAQIYDEVIPWRTCWGTGLTWNPEALARAKQASDEADDALSDPYPQGC